MKHNSYLFSVREVLRRRGESMSSQIQKFRRLALFPSSLILKMETELLSETLAFDTTLTQLVAREESVTFTPHEGFKFYVLT